MCFFHPPVPPFSARRGQAAPPPLATQPPPPLSGHQGGDNEEEEEEERKEAASAQRCEAEGGRGASPALSGTEAQHSGHDGAFIPLFLSSEAVAVEYPLQGGFHHPAALVRTPKPSAASAPRSPGAATQNGTAAAAGPYIPSVGHAPERITPPARATPSHEEPAFIEQFRCQLEYLAVYWLRGEREAGHRAGGAAREAGVAARDWLRAPRVGGAWRGIGRRALRNPSLPPEPPVRVPRPRPARLR